MIRYYQATTELFPVAAPVATNFPNGWQPDQSFKPKPIPIRFQPSELTPRIISTAAATAPVGWESYRSLVFKFVRRDVDASVAPSVPVFIPPTPSLAWQAERSDAMRRQSLKVPLPAIVDRGENIPSPPARRKRPTKNFLPRIPDPTDTNRVARFSELLSILYNSLFGQGFLVETGPSSFAMISGGIVETRPPAATDDVTVGVNPGNCWIDTTAGKVWFCIANTLNAAVWNGPF